jgi:hypothetical protein
MRSNLNRARMFRRGERLTLSPADPLQSSPHEPVTVIQPRDFKRYTVEDLNGRRFDVDEWRLSRQLELPKN